MGIGIGAFIASGVGLLVCLGGLLGLWLRRRRFARRPIEEAVCPRCRYRAADASRPCSECGADLPALGVIDASWPTRRDWGLRIVFVVLVVLPLPMIVSVSAQRFAPGLHREVTVSVIGVAAEDGSARERLMQIATRRWFASGTSVNGNAPASVSPAVTYAVPPDDATQWITSPARANVIVTPGRESLGDAAYPRRERATLDGAAARALELADALVTGGGAAASAAAGRTRTSQAVNSTSSMRAGTGGGSRVELAQWEFGPLPPDTVVPLVLHTWRSTQGLVPRSEMLILAAIILGGALLLRGWWLARRFRPQPA